MIFIVSTRPVLTEYTKIVRGEIPSRVFSNLNLEPHLKAFYHWVIDQDEEESPRVSWLFEEFHFLGISFIECDRIFNTMGRWLENYILEKTRYRPHDFKANWRTQHGSKTLYLQNHGHPGL